MLARTAPAAAIARVVAGRATPEDHRQCRTSELIAPSPHVSYALLADGLLQTIHEVGTAMIAEGGFDADQGEALIDALRPWDAYLGSLPRVSAEAGHKWTAECTGPDRYLDDEEHHPDALTVWRCSECGCRAVGYTAAGPKAAKFECYWIDGKEVVREPYEFLELHGDPPVDGLTPPPRTCAEVKARSMTMTVKKECA